MTGVAERRLVVVRVLGCALDALDALGAQLSSVGSALSALASERRLG